MDNNINKKIKVTISDDSMEACLYLSTLSSSDSPSSDCSFDGGDIFDALHYYGVTACIDNKVIADILNNKQFNKYITIARGIPAVNGTDGYFIYHFRTKIDNKPKILPDGSVDYHTVDLYEPVTAGAIVAEYVPATFGQNGMTVRGSPLYAVSGKELKPLRGTGFLMSSDHRQYRSQLNGKIELNRDVLNISNILDIHGDVDLTTGDIIFNGDVLIHGNVLMGSMIRVGGNLTILGNVESAYIEADGEIQLKSGMQGGGKGVINCKSDVWGKFFEQTIINTAGDLHANSMMNCTVFSERNIYVSGRHGIIVGGNIVCLGNIEATVIGNLAEAKTSLSVGVNEQLLSDLDDMEKKITDLKLKAKKHHQIMEKLLSIKNPSEGEKLALMLNQVKASMSAIEEQLNTLTANHEQKLFEISSSSNSKIIVKKYLYPDVKIILNGLHYLVKNTFTNVYVKDSGGVVQIINN